MTGAVMTLFRHAGKVAAGIVPTALVAGLGLPALAALVFLAVSALGVSCWIVNSSDRADRVTRMIYARHGDARCLETSPSAVVPPARPRRWSLRRRT